MHSTKIVKKEEEGEHCLKESTGGQPALLHIQAKNGAMDVER